MNLKINFQSYLIKITTYIIAIIMVLDSNSIYSKSIYSSSLSKIEFIILIVAISTLIILSNNINKNWKNYLLITSILFGYIFIYVLLQRNRIAIFTGITDLGKFILMFSLAYLVYKNSKKPFLMTAYCNVVFIVAIVSLIFWIFGSNLHLLQPTGTFLSKWNELDDYQGVLSYYNLYFETQTLNQTIRNSAIFVEAPMASLTFSMALCLEVLYQNNTKFHIIKVLVLIMAIISTVSSTGYICLLLTMGYLLLTSKSSNIYLLIVKTTIIPIILVVGMILINYFLSQKLNSNSGFSRKRDYINSFIAWINYPFMGTGIDIDGNFLLPSGIKIGKFGYSNSFGRVLGENGIYILSLYLISIINSVYTSINTKDTKRLFLTFILIYLFITTQFVNTYLMLFMFSLIFVWKPNNILNSQVN
ncbi:hypothetical protein EFP33_01950 [Lactobacillus johnsonii]|uniref:Polymerization and export protein n=2 Tax=Lactobacillus johnsonii TaxID=33959 RepID=A1YVC7_LACJH|nr:polymerization and export protein [Lactobacillus johnsonii]MCT3385399.1 hypothetical protein [Lactobacillus johnsonii]